MAGWVAGWVGGEVRIYNHSSAQPTGFDNRSECGNMIKVLYLCLLILLTSVISVISYHLFSHHHQSKPNVDHQSCAEGEGTVFTVFKVQYFPSPTILK